MESQKQIIHLVFKNNDEEHYYFTTTKAMFQQFTPKELGIARQTLYNSWKTSKYENDRIILRRGKLFTTTKNNTLI